MDYKLLTDPLLVKLLQVSDAQAFREIYLRYWKRLFQSVYRKVQSRETAEELVQNLFVQLWEKREETAIEHLEKYLQVATKYLVFNHFRLQLSNAKYLQHAATASEADYATEYAISINELSQALEQAMQQMPEKTREIFKLNRLENYTVKEISENLNIPSRTIEYHISQALKFLRLQLKDYVLLLLLFTQSF